MLSANQFRLPIVSLAARFVGIALWLVLVMGVAGCAQPQLPPFDFEKWRNLPTDKRAEYDVIFFNEMETWNLNSNRYTPGRSHIERRAEFERMAADGYFPAYVALRLAGIWPAEERDDPEALKMLLDEAARGDASAMCAVLVMPTKDTLWSEDVRRKTGLKMRLEGAAKGHHACLGSYGGYLVLGNIPEIALDRKTGMPLLIESARQGYYAAARRLFSLRYSKALRGEFDFSDREELARAICWGRLAQQHTNWAGFDGFLEKLRGYARTNDRADLLGQSDQFDPRRVPITEKIVQPDDCIKLEKGE